MSIGESVKDFTAEEAVLRVINIHQGLPDELPAELTEEILASPGLRIERIVSRGHRSPDSFWYEQEENEWVLVLSGRARLEIEGDTTETALGPGDHLLIPAGKKHRVAWTDPREHTVWLAVFFS